MVRLKHLREQHGISQNDLAQALSVTKAFISQLENGRKRVPEAMLAPLAGRLGVSPSELRSLSRLEHLRYLLEEDRTRNPRDGSASPRARHQLGRLFGVVIEIIDSGEIAEPAVDLAKVLRTTAEDIAGTDDGLCG